jgi:hypothetical protein
LYHLRWPYLFIFVLVLHLAPVSVVHAEKPEKKSDQQKLLERYAKDSLWRLKTAIKTGGFFYSRAALNIWKENTVDAGLFDEDLYNQYKRNIYEKSVNENLRWFEIFLTQKNYRDARICLQLYKLHAEEINIFDEEKYEDMEKRLEK